MPCLIGPTFAAALRANQSPGDTGLLVFPLEMYFPRPSSALKRSLVRNDACGDATSRSMISFRPVEQAGSRHRGPASR